MAMICKAIDWEEVDRNYRPIPNSSARYTAEELGIDNKVLTKFKFKPGEMVFIVTRGDKEYLVDTQGFSYARYIERIK